MISLIWAMDKNRLIGKDNTLPWRIPADLAYYKKTIAGHTVVIGRKTFEPIAGMMKRIAGKLIVMTRDKSFNAEGCLVAHNLEEALALKGDGETFISGGVEVYTMFLPYADRLYITLIEDEFAGDAWFPEFDLTKWNLVSKVKGEKDEKNPYDYYFLVYENLKKP